MKGYAEMNVRFFQGIAPVLISAPLFALLLGGAAAPVRAEEASPDPGVARVSVLNGDVELRRGDSGDASAAAINAPLLAGDYLSTHAGARAEVQFDYGNVLRAGPDAELRFTRIGQSDHVVQLAQGTVELRVFRLTDARPEIDTPSAAVRPAQSGRYRLTVTEEGNTLVTVRSGRVDIVGAQNVRSVTAGMTALVEGTASDPSFQIVDTPASDAFDRWNDERDGYVAAALSDRYVGEGIVGAADLDRYGHWVSVPGYGDVWAPYADPDWAPYRSGRWVWEGYYGWTWVSYEPWGWAPYHYGRWFYNAGYGWCWYPDRPFVHPVWQPALVAFFSFGGGGGVSIGFGNVGWVPLAPREAVNPWWGRRYATNQTTIVNNTTNVTNVTNVRNITVYRNANAPGAVTAVSHQDFAGGRFDRPVRVTPVELHAATPVRGIVPVVPTAQNLRFSDRPIARGETSAPVDRRFSRFAAPSAPVRSFEEQRADVRAATVRLYPHGATDVIHESHTPAPAFTNVAPVASPPVRPAGSPEWRRFNEPGTNRGPSGASSGVIETTRPAWRTETAHPALRTETLHPETLHPETLHPSNLGVQTAAPVHVRGIASPKPPPHVVHPHRDDSHPERNRETPQAR